MRTLIFSLILLLPVTACRAQESGVEQGIQVLQNRYRVFYDPGANAVPPGQAALLKQVAALAATLRFLRIDVDGHADRTGKPESNALLARARADAVAAALTGLGVESTVINIQDHGADQPMFERGRAKWNRRVEISVYGIPRM
jgi:outer membrane protein OmpA-like peptidoglycan-associated protein